MFNLIRDFHQKAKGNIITNGNIGGEFLLKS